MTQHLQKWHGAGNDFLVAIGDGIGEGWSASDARAICHRHFGLGADGLLLGDTANGFLTMTLFNADGSIAEMSGNGIRCLVAAYLRETGRDDSFVEVSTLAGTRRVSMQMNGDSGTGAVAMGPVTMLPSIPGALAVASVGNPHVVVMDVPEWSEHEREELALQLADLVGGANVEFLTVVDKQTIQIRIVERGVGWTMACGTGSCASAAVAHAVGYTQRDVTVRNPGGDLAVSFDEQGAVLSGPVVFVGDVEWSQG